MPGLGASFGRGAATTYQQDLANSDCVLIMGSNMAEAHPVGFRWPMKAKERGATLIHVDPRFTRTSALCDVFVGIRAGSDVAFLGGLVHYVLSNDRWFKEYVLNYTNASTIIEEGFRDTEDLAGLFSGYHGDGQTGKYDAREGHWGYEGSSGDHADRARTGDSPRPNMDKADDGIQGHDLQAGAASHSAPRQHMTNAPQGQPPARPSRIVRQVCRLLPIEMHDNAVAMSRHAHLVPAVRLVILGGLSRFRLEQPLPAARLE